MCILMSFSTKNTLIFNYLLIRQELTSALTHSNGVQRGGGERGDGPGHPRYLSHIFVHQGLHF